MKKEIFRLAWPNIITNITVPLLGIVDLAILGHLKESPQTYIGAISLGGMIFSFIYSGFSFLRMGTSGFTSQAYGRKDKNVIFYTLVRSLFLAIGIGLVMIALQKVINNVSFLFIDSSPNVNMHASKYFFIRIYAAPATLGLSVLYGWYLGLQNAKIPMIIAIVVNVVNIIANLIFVLHFDMASEGVALGTVIAQYTGFIIAILYLPKFKKYFLKIRLKEFFDISELKEFLSVNRDIFIRTISLIFAISFFTIQSANMGETTLVINTLLLQFFMLFSYIMDGFAYASEALTGKYFGRKDKVNLHKMVKDTFVISFALSLMFTIVFVILGEKMLYIFTSDMDIIAKAKPFMIWVYVVPIITFVSFIWDGIYIGATQAKMMRNIMVISTFAVFVPLFYLLKPYFANNGLWLAFMLFMIIRGGLHTILYKKSIIGKVSV